MDDIPVPGMMDGRIYIFHVDANSAFLSWSASYRVNVLGEKTDLRSVPSIVGETRKNATELSWQKVPLRKNTGYTPGSNRHSEAEMSGAGGDPAGLWAVRKCITCVYRKAETVL